jgi:hypothetical protein
MTQAEDLHAEYVAAEAEALELQRKRDEGIQMLKEQYNAQLVDARARAVAAQKAWCDAAAAAGLAGRLDAVGVARSLGLELADE